MSALYNTYDSMKQLLFLVRIFCAWRSEERRVGKEC